MATTLEEMDPRGSMQEGGTPPGTSTGMPGHTELTQNTDQVDLNPERREQQGFARATSIGEALQLVTADRAPTLGEAFSRHEARQVERTEQPLPPHG